MNGDPEIQRLNKAMERAIAAADAREPRVIATAQEDIRAGDSIEIDMRTGYARRARFGDATASQIGEQQLEHP